MGQADGRAVRAHLEGIQTGVQEAAEGDKGRNGWLSCGGRVGGDNDVDGLGTGQGRRAQEAAVAKRVTAGVAAAAAAANKAATERVATEEAAASKVAAAKEVVAERMAAKASIEEAGAMSRMDSNVTVRGCWRMLVQIRQLERLTAEAEATAVSVAAKEAATEKAATGEVAAKEAAAKKTAAEVDLTMLSNEWWFGHTGDLGLVSPRDTLV